MTERKTLDELTKVDDLVKEKLPEWAHVESDGNGEKITVEADVIYPYFLKLLGYPGDNPTQQQLESARRVMTSFLKRDVVKRFAGDNAQFRLRIAPGVKRDWKLTKFKNGEELDARAEYRRLKNKAKLPY